MRYVSIDTETTGLDPATDQVIQAAFVLEDSDHPEIPVEDLPCVRVLLKHDHYHGDAFALAMNARILRALADAPVGLACDLDGVSWTVLPPERLYPFLLEAFTRWGLHSLPVVAAGKCVATFDLPFLGLEIASLFHRRVIDPGAVFVDWRQPRPPSLGDLLTRLEPRREVAHCAYRDALDVICILRHSYPKAV